MAVLAWILGILGGLCAIMGIIIAAEVVELPGPGEAFANWMFWFGLAGVLLVACIAAVVGRSGYE